MSEANTQTVALSDRGGSTLELPLLTGSIGPSVIDIRKLYAETGRFTYDPGYTSTASCSSKITYIDGEEGMLLHRGYAIEDLATQQRLPRGRLSDHVRRAADRRAEGQVRPRRHLPHDGARADHLSVPRLPPRRPSDGGDDRGGRRAVGLLPRGPRHRGSAQPDDRELPPGRQGADDRRDGLQVFGRPAVHLPAQRSDLRRELPPDDVRGAVRALQGQPGARQGARPDLHPARRPRAERLDLDRAPGRLDRRQPLRRDRRRHRLACGARRTAAPTRRWSTC